MQKLVIFTFALLFCRYVVAGTLMNNYAHIFDLLTRLRQVSCTEYRGCLTSVLIPFFYLK